MKVLTKSVLIQNEEFVLVQDTDTNAGMYIGTIPYNELDGNQLKRRLNGFEMCVVLVKNYDNKGEAIADALKEREQRILIERFLKAHPEIDVANNINIDAYIEFVLSL